jgi:hypothetical protein
METGKKNYFKFSLSFLLCLLVRLIPFRAPNVEPILATTMPISRAYGAVASFSFAALSILLFDIITRTLGLHTFFTVFAYGALGLFSAYYFKKNDRLGGVNKDNKWSYVRFAIFGTLFYDAFTGLTVGPIFFHQSFIQSLIGQIPFTALHLLGNITFAIILSPAIYSLLIKKKEKKSVSIINPLNPKII